MTPMFAEMGWPEAFASAIVAICLFAWLVSIDHGWPWQRRDRDQDDEE